MQKIQRLVLVVEPAKKLGYDVTTYLYAQGDRAPSQSEEYRALSLHEVHTLMEAWVSAHRPGWEYSPDLEQPPLPFS
jgi:hypothetical protein